MSLTLIAIEHDICRV